MKPAPTPKASATADPEKTGHSNKGKPPKTPLILTGGRSKIGNISMVAPVAPKNTVVVAPKNVQRVSNTRNVAPVRASTTTNVSLSLGTKHTLIEKGHLRFWITDAPRQSNLHLYVKEMQKNHVKVVCRFCEPTYRSDDFQSVGIGLHDMEYKDGTSPPKELILSWLELVKKTLYQTSSKAVDGDDKPGIAVHCVAGLGRAPVMVAIALIEFGGMDAMDAVSYIRGQRRGAINEKQRVFLEEYKKLFKTNKAATEMCCVIL